MTTETVPHIRMASIAVNPNADYSDPMAPALRLTLEDKEGTQVHFNLDGVGAALLSLTLTPSLREVIAEMKAANPDKFERRSPQAPDFPTGL